MHKVSHISFVSFHFVDNTKKYTDITLLMQKLGSRGLMQVNFVQVRTQLMVNYMCMCMICVCVCIMYRDIATHTVKSSEIQKINTCCENLNVWSFCYTVVLRYRACVHSCPAAFFPHLHLIMLSFP